MIVRGIRVNQCFERRNAERSVRRFFPGTRVIKLQSLGWRRYELWWTGRASLADMRALADDIEATVPAKAAPKIECRRFDSQSGQPIEL